MNIRFSLRFSDAVEELWRNGIDSPDQSLGQSHIKERFTVLLLTFMESHKGHRGVLKNRDVS